MLDVKKAYEALHHDADCSILGISDLPVCTCAVRKMQMNVNRSLKRQRFDGVPISNVSRNELEAYFSQRVPRILTDLPRIRYRRMGDIQYVRDWVMLAIDQTKLAEEVQHRLELQKDVINSISTVLLVEIVYADKPEESQAKLRRAVETWRSRHIDFCELGRRICRQVANESD